MLAYGTVVTGTRTRKSAFHPLVFLDVASKFTRRCKLAQFMTDHLVRNEDGSVRPPVVYSDRVSDHDRYDGRSTGPRHDHRAAASAVGFLNFFQQVIGHVRTFL